MMCAKTSNPRASIEVAVSIETDPAVMDSHPFLASSPPINPKGTQEITRRMKLGHTNVPGGKGVDVPGTLFVFRGRAQNHLFMGIKVAP